jgi:hypothetical protein
VLDIVALIIFVGIAYRTYMGIRRESAIFAEFQQSTALAYTALLFPLGPIAMLVIGIRAPIIAIPICAACYLPSLVLARRLTNRFDRAGTDRVKAANAAAWEAFGAAIAGLAYAALALALLVGVGLLRGPTDA